MEIQMKEIINDYLDDCISANDLKTLQAWIETSPENARHFAREVMLHDRLANAIRNEISLKQVSVSSLKPENKKFAIPRRPVLSGMAATLVILLTGLWLISNNRLDAAAGINQLIQKSTDLGDRSYTIVNLDTQAEKFDGRRPPVDGAKFYVRGGNQYVLIRKFPDGRQFTTGFDGVQNWAVPPDGAVRLSRDPNRFRGPLPGHKHGLPFVDLRSDLIEIRDAFQISFSEDKSDRLSRLLARKKPGVRGPREVLLRFEADTGVIQEMIFSGLPQAQGGPSNLAVRLIGQETLDPGFFEHQFHHESTREVVQE